uniref:NADH-ubiquinone oxidoreductase chain 4 n=1 Tax=Gorpis humeralis TaxID=1041165 RepID=K7NB89_9HEMI|nr:NADH dehydrogenase subunit 4 [Gorpis humeralis]AEH21208.1 NADH dehydrogenase subunit 4 [Gorpis humeralis]
MMSLLLFIFMMIPLSLYVDPWLVVVLMLIMSTYLINSVWMNDYYSSLSYSLGADMLSMSLTLLSCWVIMMMLMASMSIFNNNANSVYFMLSCLLLLMALLGTFMCMNMLVFYLMFEFSLIPTLFLIFGWGYQPERLLAGYYLLFYTLFASLPLLVCIFFLYNSTYTLFYFMLMVDCNIYIYLSLIMAFLIKMPIFMFHFWLLKAHVEAPVSGSMVLAGVLLKLGGYGLMRVYMFIHDYSIYYNYIFMSLSLYSMFIVGLLCLVQLDIKTLIAYSSVCHMGLVICGIMTLNIWGLMGSLILMIGHGLCSSSLFCLANMLYERSHSRSLLINKGLMSIMPSVSFLWFISCVNNMSSPPSLNLMGEIMLINSVLSWSIMSWLFLGLSSFLSCCYSIYLYSYINHGSLYSGMVSFNINTFCDYILIGFHLLPLNMLFMKVDIFLMWL